MVTVIKKGTSFKRINKALENLKKPQKVLNASKYCGTIRLSKDAMKIQSELRNEWK